MELWLLTGGKFLQELRELEKKFESIKDFEVKVVNCEDMTFIIDKNLPAKLWVEGERVNPPDAFLITDLENPLFFSRAKQLENLGSFSINPIEKRKMSLKITTYELLAKAGIPVPKTLIFKNHVNRELLIEEIGLPMVLKPEDGYGGEDVSLIKTEEELDSMIETIKKSNGNLLVQEYISTSKGKDLRVQTIGYEAIFVISRKASNPEEFRSNVKLGGIAEEVELTDELKDLSYKVSKTMGLNLLGIDFLYGEDGYVVVEVNTAPGFTEEVAEKFIKSFLQYLKIEISKMETPHWKTLE